MEGVDNLSMIKNDIKLSFILPCYNVEKYIGECLDSIYNQNMPESEYEVICVDDCSPDRSREIIMEYKITHSNLVLLSHKENRRLGGARNTGLDNAKGAYVWFVDSDDKISPNCLKTLMDDCVKNDLDVLMFNFQKIDNGCNIIYTDQTFSDSVVYDGLTFVSEYFGPKLIYYLGYAWRQLYRTDYVKSNQIRFPENVFWEDTAFMPRSLMMAGRVRSIGNAFYQYRVNPDSVSGVYDREFRADLIYQFAFDAGNDLMIFSREIRQKSAEMADILQNRSLWYINSFIFRLLKAPLRQKIKFFKLLKDNSKQLNQLKPHMNTLNRFLCSCPSVGLPLMVIGATLYRLKRFLKKKYGISKEQS
jgi:glycosyltransferase involved in cell wall biosynthesis